MQIIESISHVATTLGIVFAAWQLRLTRQQSQTTFEDIMAKEYRELAHKIPTKAFLGEELDAAEHAEALNEFYHYFDLSNEQVFLRQKGRISSQTWTYWRDGIRGNLKRPAFKTAWDHISHKAVGDFKELRLLKEQDFQIDPYNEEWGRLIALPHVPASAAS